MADLDKIMKGEGGEQIQGDSSFGLNNLLAMDPEERRKMGIPDAELNYMKSIGNLEEPNELAAMNGTNKLLAILVELVGGENGLIEAVQDCADELKRANDIMEETEEEEEGEEEEPGPDDGSQPGV